MDAIVAAKPVVIVDVMNLVFRSHWTFQNLSSEGRPTGVIFGALRAINELRQNVSKRIVFVWDHGVPVIGAPKPRNWRDDFFIGYKGTRHQDEDVRKLVFSQLPDLHRLICTLGYSSVAVMGLEADDLIGILDKHITMYGEPVRIFSTDQDFYQLLDNQTQIIVPKKDKGSFQFITREDVEKEFGISVFRWAEFLALGGDKSDNIKPMRGMGPKTAIKLLQNGVNLNRQACSQPDLFAKYQPVWEQIQKCYSAARLPTKWNDPRVMDCTKGKPIPFHTEQQWPGAISRSLAVQEFDRFCADRDLTTILSIRRQLFDTGELVCPKPSKPEPPAPVRWQRKTLV